MSEATGDAGSSMTLAIVGLTVLLGMFGAIIFLVLRMTGEEEKPEPKGAAKSAQKKPRGALDRMQRGAARAAGADDGAADDNEDEHEDEGRAGRRGAQKDQKKQEKKAQQQHDREARQQKEDKQAGKNTKYAQKQQEKEAERLKQEEEEKKAAEEQARKEKEEFDSWKEMFAVDAEGQDDGAEAGNAIEQFISYIRTRKVVNLEDLAADFRMRTSAAIERIRELEKLGRLSGIFDDRGKFVYVTVEEMAATAEWLQKKGRVGRADLVAACNRIIRLNPTEEDKAKLESEAQSAVDALEEDAPTA